MYSHESYGVQPEKEPPFSIVVRVRDQDGYGLHALVTVQMGSQVYKQSGAVTTFRSAFTYDLDEITVTVVYNGRRKTVKPRARQVDIVYQVNKTPPAKPSTSYSSAPKPRPRRISTPRRHKEIIKGKRETDKPGKDAHDIFKGDDVVELNPGEKMRLAVEEFDDARHHDVLKDMYTLMARKDVPAFMVTIRSIALILNKELQKKVKGKPSFKITSRRSGPMALRRVIPTIASGQPRMFYYDLLDRKVQQACTILVDISGSTGEHVMSHEGTRVMIKHALLLAALGVAEVMLELGGAVDLLLFSDDDSQHHGRLFKYSRSTQRSVIEELLDIPPAGGTRLDEVLGKVKDPGNHYQRKHVFIFMDGCPMEGYFRVDRDDEIQRKTIQGLKNLERKYDLFILWASSPINLEKYDDFFFSWCKKELVKSTVVNVQSFVELVKHAQDIWQMPERELKRETIYNTNEVFPFIINDGVKQIAVKLSVPGDAGKAVENIRQWILENFKYSYPRGRKYRTAIEVINAGNGCCGELSNLIVGMLRSINIPSGIVEADYANQVRINHAHVGYIIDGKPFMIDVTMGEINTTRAIGSILSDARWQRLMHYWRGTPRAVEIHLDKQAGKDGI
ncbi:hypothetical protein GF325_10580 [Candidatus Bathyarchaeota archaeon]|nr:hypothetical protein [Candidatus Bathyarchaeota archaeon]